MPKRVNADVVCIAPRKWEITEDKWIEVMEEYKRTGRCVRPMRIKEMFPEDFSEYRILVEP